MQKSLAFVRGFFVFRAGFSSGIPALPHSNTLIPFGQLSLVRCGAYPLSFLATSEWLAVMAKR